jgi:hypothetical protein
MGSRRNDIPVSVRLQLAIEMLNPRRPHGRVTALAQEQHLSRQSLYSLAAQATQALLAHLAPALPGPPPPPATLTVDRPRLRRSILRLSLAGLSQRHVQAVLADLFAVPVALGTVHNSLARYEARAAALNTQWHPACAEGLAADELFAHRQPHLLIVGNDSLFIYAHPGRVAARSTGSRIC